MTCGGCSNFVQKFLKSQEGVNEVNVSLEKGEADVQFDESKTSAEKLIEVLNSKTHYKAEAA